MDRLILLGLIALVSMPAAHALEPQFWILTENGNSFLISPPAPPRPANVISETAHLSAKYPPAGLFMMSDSNGTTKSAPMHAGLDISGFASGKVRAVTLLDWRSGTDVHFRDQPFGEQVGSNNTYHHRYMPLDEDWADSYEKVVLQDTSRFGLGSGGAGNTLPHSTDSALNGVQVGMGGGRDRAGLNFGPGTGSDHVYYIYRGCASCMGNVAIGHSSPNSDREALPNDQTVTDHVQGWRSQDDCTTDRRLTWSGTGARTLTDKYDVPDGAHSNANNYGMCSGHVDDHGNKADCRYHELSILPRGHTVCPHDLYTVGDQNPHYTQDNRKHDMCMSELPESAASTHWSCRQKTVTTVRTYTNGSYTERTSTVYSTVGAIPSRLDGSCSNVETTGLSDGYSLSGVCRGSTGETPVCPADTDTGPLGSGNKTKGSITRTTTTHTGPTATTTARIQQQCLTAINTPHLDLEDAMTLKPGLNVYRPGSIPAAHDILVIYDDARAGGGSTERIQVFRSASYGDDPAGPYDFRLLPSVSGVLYDPHNHYGWVNRGVLYDTDELASMSYTQGSALVGFSDGDGSYSDGSRICHGDCLLGYEGTDFGKPLIRKLAPSAVHSVTSSTDGLVYDHVNERWFAVSSTDNRVSAAVLYLVVPFSEDIAILDVHLFSSDRFDPTRQGYSPRESPAQPNCHQTQGHRNYEFADSINGTEGGALYVPVLPGIRYIAFIGNAECYWYDTAALPSPLSSVSAGARHVELLNGTVLTGDLSVKHGGVAHVDVFTDFTAAWQSEMYGKTEPSLDGNVTWVAPPLKVNVTAVARVNGASGDCGSAGVHCIESPIMVKGTSVTHPSIPPNIEDDWHGKPYQKSTKLSGSTKAWGVPDGRCYGVVAVEATTGSLEIRSLHGIRVNPGDTITFEFAARVITPYVQGGNVTANIPGYVCNILETRESAVLNIGSMTATLR